MKMKAARALLVLMSAMLSSGMKSGTNAAGVTWEVWVTTSNIDFANTDANCYIELYGKDGRHTNPFVLDDPNRNDNEKGHTDRHIWHTDDVGEPDFLRVWHDNINTNPGWHLRDIKILNEATHHEYTFYANRWLATTMADGKIQIDLKVHSDHLVGRK